MTFHVIVKVTQKQVEQNHEIITLIQENNTSSTNEMESTRPQDTNHVIIAVAVHVISNAARFN